MSSMKRPGRVELTEDGHTKVEAILIREKFAGGK